MTRRRAAAGSEGRQFRRRWRRAAGLRAAVGRVRRHAAAGEIRRAAISAVRSEHGQGPRAAARRRRPEAGAGAHPLCHVGDERARRHAAQEIRARGRRRAGQIPSAWRRLGLRRDGAHRAGLQPALSAGGRRGQLRLARRRRAGGDALHRGAPDQIRRGAARRTRQRHRGFRAQLRRQHGRAAGAAGAPAGACCSTALRASPWAWPPRFPATT